ncbi:putative lipid II flippase FtsW [bacterium (Candidatus Howlettbacteria) CG_4_10_14_0_8_um_filter_40_9]|nr:MAG: putative lipid II flippase FtsW [bacterium (Candidatus Howlettbacteria) CG_4_10_14_0_8_um_filter_40_9]
MVNIAAKRERRFKPDYTLAFLVYLLVLIGAVMVFSASVVISYQVSGGSTFYFTRQLLSIGIGTIIFLIASRVNYNFWRKIAPYLFALNILLLIMVFVPGIGLGHGGANRWINLGIFTFQPTETLKLSTTIFLAYFFEKIGKDIKGLLTGLAPFLVILGIISFLVMKQPDMGTFIVTAMIAVGMFFVAGANMAHVSSLGLLGLGGLGLLIKSASYRMARFMVFLNPGADAGGSGYHINQALLAIGTGGLFGLGFGQSRQKYQYLPEAATDSIFAVMTEELGFIFSSIVVLVFVGLSYRVFKLARSAPDTFSRLLATGVGIWVLAQTFLNIAAMMSLVPLTGVPLPFISYGGSSIMFLLLAFGILINISRYSVVKERR